ncbi:hypothetical protein FNYG_15299 [Fusarium nygamai]|uniref:Prion-inhibition and propagation HeLo domain-containing protein n=1 Tax=Gibberella nygamai TaxID=42673 RepID=A0A2K0UGP2_GIBNY|nr:hypothetical protein FNYG_15299 [Fusarium nygamai]
MVGFGEVAAGISLVQLFSLCVDGLRTLSRARNSPTSVMDFSIKLDLETSRLVLWGRNSGVAAGELHSSLEPVQPLLFQILSALSRNIQDADGLKTKYGIHNFESEMKNSPAPGQAVDSAVDNVDILLTPVVQAGLQQQQAISEKIGTCNNFFRKATWAISDGKKSAAFLEDIKRYVDGLNQLLTESQQVLLADDITAMKIALMGSKWGQPINMLTAIEAATLNCHRSIALTAKLTRLRLEMEMETTAPALSSEGPVLETPLPIGDDQFRRVDKQQGMRVMVERGKPQS